MKWKLVFDGNDQEYISINFLKKVQEIFTLGQKKWIVVINIPVVKIVALVEDCPTGEICKVD